MKLVMVVSKMTKDEEYHRRMIIIRDIIEEKQEEISSCVVMTDENKLRDNCGVCPNYKICIKIMESINGKGEDT